MGEREMKYINNQRNNISCLPSVRQTLEELEGGVRQTALSDATRRTVLPCALHDQLVRVERLTQLHLLGADPVGRSVGRSVGWDGMRRG